MTYSEFDDFLNETNNIIEVAGFSFLPSTVLYELDPIGYEHMYQDMNDSMNEDK